MKNYNVQLNEEDLKKIIGALDLAVKTIGLNGSMELIILASKIDNQVTEQDKPKENHGNDI